MVKKKLAKGLGGDDAAAEAGEHSPEPRPSSAAVGDRLFLYGESQAALQAFLSAFDDLMKDTFVTQDYTEPLLRDLSQEMVTIPQT